MAERSGRSCTGTLTAFFCKAAQFPVGGFGAVAVVVAPEKKKGDSIDAVHALVVAGDVHRHVR